MVNSINLADLGMSGFCEQHQLPPAFQATARKYYLPLAETLQQWREIKTTADGVSGKPDRAPLLLGINGAQGTGKSTLADFLHLACSELFKWNVAVLSIDDFYLTRAERRTLATSIHPLFATRGVPGTHDTALLASCLKRLQTLGEGESTTLPRFDKAADERADESDWPSIAGPVDLIILEGWCVGSKHQSLAELEQPVNELERDEDCNREWRTYVNRQLDTSYAKIFELIDRLVFLQVPSFDAILRWRLEQEQKLARKSADNSGGLMDRAEIVRFIQHFERLTKANLQSLPAGSDLVFRLDESHNIASAL